MTPWKKAIISSIYIYVTVFIIAFIIAFFSLIVEENGFKLSLIVGAFMVAYLVMAFTVFLPFTLIGMIFNSEGTISSIGYFFSVLIFLTIVAILAFYLNQPFSRIKIIS